MRGTHGFLGPDTPMCLMCAYRKKFDSLKYTLNKLEVGAAQFCNTSCHVTHVWDPNHQSAGRRLQQGSMLADAQFLQCVARDLGYSHGSLLPPAHVYTFERS